jgi:hypothetical protein
MSGPPAARPSNVGNPTPPLIEVRLGGRLKRKVYLSGAEEFVARGWADWRGSGRRRHVELSDRAPECLVGSPRTLGRLPRGGDGTRPTSADGSGNMVEGQAFGARSSHLEHSSVRPCSPGFAVAVTEASK